MKAHLHLINGYKKLYKTLDKGAVFCAVDTETTGLHCGKDRITEISAVKFNFQGVTDRFSTLLNPGILIPPFCVNLTHITNEMVSSAPKFDQIAQSFLDFTEGAIIVAHNAQFDLRFINAELEFLGKAPLANRAIDTLKLSRYIFPDNEHWSLQHLAKQFNIEVNAAHRAEDDARVCMELFLICLEELKKNQGKPSQRLA